MNLENFEKRCDEIREENEKYLQNFKEDNRNLSPKTISRHVDNVSFYINEYLLRNEPLTMEQGTSSIDGFLGDFFIRKCMWSTSVTIKSTAASIKKFYKSMEKHGFIEKRDYDDLCLEIKETMDQWLEECARFNDPDEDDDEFTL